MANVHRPTERAAPLNHRLRERWRTASGRTVARSGQAAARTGIGALAAAAVALGLMGSAARLAAQPDTKRPVELADYYRVESAGSPAMSPDGRWVAMVRTFIIEPDNRRQSEVWLAPADGSAPATRLTSPAFSSSNPIWSPDGTLLAFTSRRRVPGAGGARDGGDADSSIWFLRMDRPGGEAFQIEGVEGTPIFSPDSHWIAFTRAARIGPPSKPAFESDFDRKVHERFKGRVFDWMNYRFDGRGYLPDPRDPEATPPRELFVVARAGGSARQVTRLGVDVQSAAWRPDGQAFAVIADAHQRDEYTYGRADLWIVGLDGDVRRVTDDGFDHGSPVWSPDGRAVVVRRQQGLNAVIASRQGHGAAVDLYRLSLSNLPPVNLTASWDLIPQAQAWSPDGRFVYFSGGIGGATHLFRAPAGGGTVEQVTKGERRVGAVSIARGFERIAYTSTEPTRPAEVYASAADGTDERKLSGFTDGFVAQVDLRPAERLQFASKDGTPVEGWIILPRGYEASKGPYPLILAIHGGPHGAYGYDFSLPWQLWAAQGYAVLYTNPRGSTGYGEKFLWGTWGGWGNHDYEDVMAGVDHALARYALDPRRLGVTGYSYGGFLTNWVITHTTRFRAAISGAGISNWISDYGTADIPRTKESEFFGTPWDPAANALLRRQSPIEHVGAATTPTLFIHGESDLRVPIEQAEQMYTALKKRRIPARFARYPDSYHGSWAPWDTVHRYSEELRWWAEYLGPAQTGTGSGSGR